MAQRKPPRRQVRKISLEELNRQLADPDIPDERLARYFKPAEEVAPMVPALAIDQDRVEVADTAEARARSAALLNGVNWIARIRREIRFNRRIGDPSYSGPVIVSEGDSWFQYPLLLKDVIDWLMDDYAVMSLGAAGDTLGNMAAEMEMLEALEDTGASVLLLSGGGNDLVAGGNLAAHLREDDGSGTMKPEDYLLPSFGQVLDEAVALIDRIVRDACQSFPAVQVACHGYDYAVPAAGKWLGTPMQERKITDPKVQKAIARVMVDRLNARLRRLADGVPRLTYLDVRGSVGDAGWHDELHPVSRTYRKVAVHFQRFIQEMAPAPRRVAHGVRRGRPREAERATAALRRRGHAPANLIDVQPPAEVTGRSLHLGLNFVDPAHYAGWDGELAACEADAHDMEALARDAGFTDVRKFLTAQATRETVIGEIRAAADELESGDMFLMTVSCHGGQVPDFNRDEADAIDETLCLYDAQLIDDELHALWARFKPGVRILVISDSCHSGTVVKAQRHEAIGTERREALGRPRFMPTIVAAKTARQNRVFYREVAAQIPARLSDSVTRSMASPVSAAVRLLSGCQDHQYSYDGLLNGRFTGTLLQIWDQGSFVGNYDAFHRAIVELMPLEQTPNHMTLGQANPAYDAQRPFEL